MVIAIDIRALSQATGGVVEYTRNIVRSLIECETVHTYVLFTNAWKGEHFFDFPVSGPHHRIVEFHYPNKLFHAALYFFHHPALDVLIEKKIGKKIDVFFFPNMHFMALSDKTRAVLTVHDFSFMIHPDLLSFKSFWWHRCVRPQRMIARMQHILAVSHVTKNDCMKLFKKDPGAITVTHLDCDESFHAASHDTQEQRGEKKNILLLGAHERRKNARAAIEAFALVRKRNDDAQAYTLVLVARKGRVFQELERRIHELDLSDSVVLIPPQSNDQRLKLYAHARVLLDPSIYEGFGLPIVEAALLGVPIIAAASSSIGEVIGQGAILVDPTNVEDIATALAHQLSRDGIEKQIIQAAQDSISDFSWQETATITRAVLERVAREDGVCV